MGSTEERKAQALLARQLAESFGWVVLDAKRYEELMRAHSEMTCGAWHRERRAAGITAPDRLA